MHYDGGMPAAIASELLTAFRRRWKVFLGIHIAANALLLLVLAPLASLLGSWLILASGDVALTDEDILFFVLTPRGLAVTTVMAAMTASLAAFEFAALFIAAFRAEMGQPVQIGLLGRYLLERVVPVFGMAVRMVLRTALTAAPFLLAVGALYWTFLSEFDINFYLSTRPPVFLACAAAAALILLALAWVLLRVFAGWVVALPLVLVDRLHPREALARSRTHSRAMRKPVGLALLGWALATSLLLSIAGGLLDLGLGLANWLVGDDLARLAWTVGGLLVLWSLTNLAITFFSNTLGALLILRGYRYLFPGAEGPGLAPAARDSALRRARLTAWVSLAAVVGLGSVAGTWLYRNLESLDLVGEDTLVIAHRGASIDAPENTLAAIEEAIRQGADYVEIDVQETAEGHILVIHDRDLMKVGGSPLRVWDAPFEALRAVDVGSWHDPRYADERVPTLDEVLELSRGRVRLNIELKYYGQEQRFEELVVAAVEAADMADQVVFMSLKLGGVRRLKALRPDWKVGLLSTVAIGDLAALEVDFFAVNGRFATRNFVRRAQDREHLVLVWTINDPLQMAAMMGRNVNGIITDKPALAVEVREQRAELEPYERFLIQFGGLLGGRVDPRQ